MAGLSFSQAQTQGIGHFTGALHVEVDGDTAVATAHFQILAADDRPFELAAHGGLTLPPRH